MSNCLDCGYLFLTWNNKEHELNASQRGEMLEILEGIATGGRHINRDPRYLSCYRRIPGFPGKEHPVPRGLVASQDPNKRSEHIRDMKKAFEALKSDWDCEYFTPHQPGMKASGHIELQTRQEWEEKQEQDRRDWEEKQRKEISRRQWIAIVISIVALLVSIFMSIFL